MNRSQIVRAARQWADTIDRGHLSLLEWWVLIREGPRHVGALIELVEVLALEGSALERPEWTAPGPHT